jgi:beta-phosphoglucomutase-like phosphatase (HAD superfamily)
VRVTDGARQVLTDLRSRHLLIGGVAAKSRALLDLDLERSALANIIDTTVSGSDVTVCCPHPGVVRRCMRQMRVHATETALVSREPLELIAAHATSVTAVGLAGDGARDAAGESEVGSLAELVPHLVEHDWI